MKKSLGQKNPSWWQKSSETLKEDLNPTEIIIGCPFHQDNKVIRDVLKKVDISDAITSIEPKSYNIKSDLISSFNEEKTIIYNVYRHVFDLLTKKIYDNYKETLDSVEIITPSFLGNLDIQNNGIELTDMLLKQILEYVELYKDDIRPHIEKDISAFKFLQDNGNRNIGQNNLLNSYMAGIDTMIDPVLKYFSMMNKYNIEYSLRNGNKLNIPKHIYYLGSLTQYHAWIISQALNIVFNDKKLNVMYDESTTSGFIKEVEEVFIYLLETQSFSDFKNYYDKKGVKDFSNLVLPLEDNYGCAALGQFANARGILIGILIQKFDHYDGIIYR